MRTPPLARTAERSRRSDLAGRPNASARCSRARRPRAPSSSDRRRCAAAASAWLGRCCPTATRWSRRTRTSSPGRLTHAERLPTHGEHLQRRRRREPALALAQAHARQPEAANTRRFRNHESGATSSFIGAGDLTAASASRTARAAAPRPDPVRRQSSSLSGPRQAAPAGYRQPRSASSRAGSARVNQCGL
jgi:hypothetical protein